MIVLVRFITSTTAAHAAKATLVVTPGSVSVVAGSGSMETGSESVGTCSQVIAGAVEGGPRAVMN